MSRDTGRLWVIRVRGRWAHFGGVPFGPDRTTMIVPSHSAVVGILRSVFGKYESRWAIEELAMLSKPRIVPIALNQLQDFSARDGGTVDVQKRRTQRIWTFLQDPDFVIRARITVGAAAGADDNLLKFDNMIERRLGHGYRQYQPYFGIRECTAHLTHVTDESSLPPPVDVTQDLGMTFYDMDIDDPAQPAYLAPIRIDRGVVRYPSIDEVRKHGFRYELKRAS